MSQEQTPEADFAKQLDKMFRNNVATMDRKGRLTYVDTKDHKAYLDAMSQPRWQLITKLVDDNEISTVFLSHKSGGCFFESAFIKSSTNGNIDIIDRHRTYKEAQREHKQIVRFYNHQKVFGTKDKTANHKQIFYTLNHLRFFSASSDQTDSEYVFRSKPNELHCKSYLSKEAKHRTIKMKRRMKKLLSKLK